MNISQELTKNLYIGQQRCKVVMANCTFPQRRWAKDEIPFVIHPSLGNSGIVHQAMDIWKQNTRIIFVDRKDPSIHPNFVHFIPSAQRRSYSYYGNGVPAVGCMGVGEQFIALHSQADIHVALHEIGHAIGLYHEHTRTDRDSWVKVLDFNIASGCKPEFDIKGTFLLSAYDYSSIMHYRDNEFSVGGNVAGAKPTLEIIQPKFKNLTTTMGRLQVPSNLDIESINNWYKSI